jgi:hypothetical protein
MGGLGGGLRNVDWASQSLTKFEKNFYREHPKVSARSDAEIAEFRKQKEMKVCARCWLFGSENADLVDRFKGGMFLVQ